VVLARDVPEGRTISYGRTFTTPRPMRIATIGAGYADGYPRILSNRGAQVLIGGHRCPLLGRVTMDLIMADVSQLPPKACEPGAEVVLMGRQGQEEILAADLAEKAETIAYEIFTGISARVPRAIVGR
jgi:alanine racemase